MAVLFREGLVLNIIQSTKDGIFTQFEHMELSVKAGKTQMRLCIIYRPPPSGQNRFKATMFLDEWSNYLDRLTTMAQEVIIIGDLNFHFDDPTDINVRRFTGQLDAYGLVQHVTGATHIRGHTLDVIITRESSSIIKGSPSIVDPCLYDSRGKDSGDHFAIQVTLDCAKPQHSKKEITCRRSLCYFCARFHREHQIVCHLIMYKWRCR